MTIFQILGVDSDLDIVDAERWINLSNAKYKQPEFGDVMVKDIPTRVLCAKPDLSPEQATRYKAMLFPVSPIQIVEWEYIAPSEWQVLYIGMIDDLPEQISSKLQGRELFSPQQPVVALRVNHMLTDLGGRNMSERIYFISVVMRVEGGVLIRPEPYVHHEFAVAAG